MIIGDNTQPGTIKVKSGGEAAPKWIIAAAKMKDETRDDGKFPKRMKEIGLIDFGRVMKVFNVKQFN